jgi:5'-AMP-activated protein kinase catalytic alpha subunit
VRVRICAYLSSGGICLALILRVLTSAYLAPEVIKEEPHTLAVDIWSAGVLLYFLSFAQLPFTDDSLSQLFQKIVFSDPVVPAGTSPILADLIRKMLTKEPDKRITLEKIRNHAWFSRSEYVALQRLVSPKSDSRFADNGIDPAIVQRMAELGFSSPSLKSQLFHRRSTDLTALYRMLLREQTTELVHEVIERVQRFKTCSMDIFDQISDADLCPRSQV